MVQQASQFKVPAWLRIVLIGRRPKFTLIRTGVVILAACVVFPFMLLPVKVTGPSMLPTYHDGQINFVNRLAYLRHEPRRGDVVGVRLSDVSVMYMKRVIALPGETVSFDRGLLLINGEPTAEPYVKLPCLWTTPPVRLSSQQYFVVGDNRSMPPRDHTHGTCERFRIVGKVLL
jgi:signal peptidase I